MAEEEIAKKILSDVFVIYSTSVVSQHLLNEMKFMQWKESFASGMFNSSGEKRQRNSRHIAQLAQSEKRGKNRAVTTMWQLTRRLLKVVKYTPQRSFLNGHY